MKYSPLRAFLTEDPGRSAHAATEGTSNIDTANEDVPKNAEAARSLDENKWSGGLKPPFNQTAAPKSKFHSTTQQIATLILKFRARPIIRDV
jgi:hypothetical protein